MSFAEYLAHNERHIRKGLSATVLVKRAEVGDVEINALFGAGGLLSLPSGYEPVGLITKDQGLGWTKDVEDSTVMSNGVAQPTRRDITSVTEGLEFTAQESKALTLGLHGGLDLSAVTQDANGNVSWDTPDRPETIRYRVLALFKDGDGADAVYFASWLPNAQITNMGEKAYNEENEVQYPLTFTAYHDSEVGTAKRDLIAGPSALLTSMGFAVAPVAPTTP